MLVEIKNQTYPSRCFLNIDLPTSVAKHKVNFSKILWFKDAFLALTFLLDASSFHFNIGE